MRRSRWIASAVIGGSLCANASGFAQQPAAEGWVVLPIEEYRDLRDRARGVISTPVAARVDATLSRIDYNLNLDGGTVTGHALLTVDVMREGWVRIPIPRPLRVTDARLDGQPLAIVDGPSPYLLLSRTGRTVAELEIVVPVTMAAGTESIAVPAAPVPMTRVTLTLPRSEVELSVAGGFVLEHADAGDRSGWTVVGRPGEPMTLTWKRRIDDRRASLPLRTRGRITELVTYGEDLCQLSASVRAEVMQGSLSEVVLAVPSGLIVNEVSGPTVANWAVAANELHVRLLEPVTTDVGFVVAGEMRVPRDGAMGVPIVRMPAAERETGGVAVDIAGAGEIGEHQAQGLEPADLSELGDEIARHESPSLIAFRLRPLAGTDARALNVSVVRYTPEAVLVANIEEARYKALVADGRILVDARYAIRNNRRSFLKVSLPAGATIWSASVDGRPVRPGVAENDAVLLPLSKDTAVEEAPASVVKLVYLQSISVWSRGARVSFEPPAVDLPVSRSGLQLFYPPSLTLRAEPGPFRLSQDTGPFSDALKNAPARVRAVAAPKAISNTALQTLVDRYRSSGERRGAGALPVDVNCPEFGPSLFFSSELTAESRAPVLWLNVRSGDR